MHRSNNERDENRQFDNPNETFTIISLAKFLIKINNLNVINCVRKNAIELIWSVLLTRLEYMIKVARIKLGYKTTG